MNPDEFINAAIETGSGNGIETLDADQRLVYLVSEAEVYCDMEGIDGFVDRYSPERMEEAAAAFAEIGAAEIAMGMRAIAADTTRDGQLLGRVNELISRRTGYDYDAIRKAIGQRLAKRSP